MECEKKGKDLLLMAFMLAGLVSTAVSRTLDGFGDQKNYYPPDPHASSPPKRSHKTTPSCPTPSHGSGGGYSRPPTPSHGSGGGYSRPPTPSHGSGGGYSKPPTPTRGGGGYYNPPSRPAVVSPPSPPYEPITPAPLIPAVPPTPSTPTVPSPPLVPYDPNNPSPGTCNYWRTHPALIWGVFGYWGTLSQFFGLPAATVFGRNASLLEALSNTRGDGIGALFREGTASLLNSMVDKRFAFTTQQVKEAFDAAVASNRAAALQAQLFKKANEGHLKHV